MENKIKLIEIEKIKEWKLLTFYLNKHLEDFKNKFLKNAWYFEHSQINTIILENWVWEDIYFEMSKKEKKEIDNYIAKISNFEIIGDIF